MDTDSRLPPALEHLLETRFTERLAGKLEGVIARKLDDLSLQQRMAQEQLMSEIRSLSSAGRRKSVAIPADSSHAALINLGTSSHSPARRNSLHDSPEVSSPKMKSVKSCHDLELSMMKDLAALPVRKQASRKSGISISDSHASGTASRGLLSVTGSQTVAVVPSPPASAGTGSKGFRPAPPDVRPVQVIPAPACASEEDASVAHPNTPSYEEETQEKASPAPKTRKKLFIGLSTDTLQVDPALSPVTVRQNSWQSGAVTMENMNRNAHQALVDEARVLAGSGSRIGEESDEVEVEWDMASRVLLRFPWCVRLFVAVPALVQTVAVIVLKCLGIAQTVAYTFTMVSVILYGMVGTFGVHLLLKSLQSDNFNTAMSRLHMFVADWKVHWTDVSTLESRRCIIAWFVMVCCYACAQLTDALMLHQGPVDSGQSGRTEIDIILLHTLEVTSTLSFAISAAVVLMVAFIQSHLLLGLDKSLDCWCNAIWLEPDFGIGATSWNCLQALLKCVGRELGRSFIAVQALGSVGFVFFLASVVALVFRTDVSALPVTVEAMSSLPLLFLFAVNLRTFATAAALTEKCRNIPAFVNQIPSEAYIDMDRQYLVRFICDSSPGFFVRDVRLTQEMFLKQFLLVGGLLSGLFGVLSRIYL
mmetsp:Transcript_4606/g.10812  ORF Transcript_4606/g.10812 Transcript_4606/m.10812 type:complete len:647 (-) Transcript_4606:31-1971(-)